MASIMGDDARIRLSIVFSSGELLLPPTLAKKSMTCFAETVFPAPDSPDTMIDWFAFFLKMKDSTT